MTDIVERLRKHREYQKGNSIPCNWHPLICTEAADEIKRLREMNDNQYQRLHDQIELNAKMQGVLRAIECEFENGSWQRRDIRAAIAAAEDEK